jgi:hypothetical protein
MCYIFIVTNTILKHYVYIYMYKYILYIWINDNDLTATSLETWLVLAIIPI